MEKINAVITGVGGYVPEYVLTNDELSRMVETNDEWIMTRIGVKERRILSEEGLGTSYLCRKAAKQLMKRTGANPDDIDAVIVCTTTPDYHFPSTASILCDKLGLKNAFAFDLSAACCGFLYGLEVAAGLIATGRHKKIILVGGDKMSSMVNYSDRATCPIFGDGAAAVMMEATTEDLGVKDVILRTDGKGLPFLHMKAGGSVCPPSYFTVSNKMHYLYQEGRTVFKYAVSNMSNITGLLTTAQDKIIILSAIIFFTKHSHLLQYLSFHNKNVANVIITPKHIQIKVRLKMRIKITFPIHSHLIFICIYHISPRILINLFHNFI